MLEYMYTSLVLNIGIGLNEFFDIFHPTIRGREGGVFIYECALYTEYYGKQQLFFAID